jgi:hypothetical protein
MFYAVVGLQFRKMYIGIMYLQIYIFSDTWRESYTGMHVAHRCNIWLQQRAIILIEDTQLYKYKCIYIYIYINSLLLSIFLTMPFYIALKYLSHYANVLLYYKLHVFKLFHFVSYRIEKTWTRRRNIWRKISRR